MFRRDTPGFLEIGKHTRYPWHRRIQPHVDDRDALFAGRLRHGFCGSREDAVEGLLLFLGLQNPLRVGGNHTVPTRIMGIIEAAGIGFLMPFVAPVHFQRDGHLAWF